MSRTYASVVLVLGIALAAPSAWGQSAPASAPATQPDAAQDQALWRQHRQKEFSLAVPAGWRELELMPGKYVLYLSGDGVGAPLMDETGQPIQTGLAVERYPETKATPAQGAAHNLKRLAAEEGFRILGEGEVLPLKLSDGTPAVLLSVEFLRTDKDRRCRYEKLFTVTGDGTGWVVTAWIVTGDRSLFAQKHAHVVQRLRAHAVSLCFDPAKYSDAAVRAAYEPKALPTTRLGDDMQKRIDATQLSVQNAAVAVERFLIDIGRYPTADEGLGALTVRPAFADETLAEKWRGPYLKPADLNDAWGHPLNYQPAQAAEKSAPAYRIHSAGPDGKSGTEDDIRNWTEGR